MAEFIEIRGARENNLQEVSLRIPKRKLTIFTGVSGSGKSSIVFDTIATEAQRQLYENFSLFIRNFLPRYPQPDADAIENLNMAVIVDQKRLGGGAHSTVGTVTDIYGVLRLLFSRDRASPPRAGPSPIRSTIRAACARSATAWGRRSASSRRTFSTWRKSLNEGAVQVPFFNDWEQQAYLASGFFDNDKKLGKYTKAEMELLLHGKDRKFKAKFGERSINLTFTGHHREDRTLHGQRRQKRGHALPEAAPLPALQRRAAQPGSPREQDQRRATSPTWPPWRSASSSTVARAIKEPRAAPIVAALTERLENVVGIGLEYLSLDRETDTLSGGESQRVRIVKHLGSSLVDVLYIFDEPSVGLHPRDVHRLNELLGKLRDRGNSVIVVEHDPAVIKAADHVIDVGPGAGPNGGHIVFEGTYEELLKSDTLTGKHLTQELPVKKNVRTATGRLRITNARANNLKDISVDIPTGVLTLVTGVAGSGKSSLINEVFLVEHPEAVVIDQSAVATSTRSNPATYTGVMDDIRKAFAAANKVDAGLFSFNSKGACEACNGSGVVYTDLGYLAEFKSPCEVCQGRRFKDEVLGVQAGWEVHQRRARAHRGPGARLLQPQGDRPQARSHARRGPGLPDPGPTAVDAFRRRMPAHQARQRAAQGRVDLRHG